MKIFIDTTAWLALEVLNDSNHKKAQKHAQEIMRQRVLLFTSDYVLNETYTRLIYNVHLKAAQKFHRSIQKGLKSNLTLFEVDYKIRNRAWKELTKYRDHQLSFTDATIVAQFKNYRLDEIFTFDHHFRSINLPTNL